MAKQVDLDRAYINCAFSISHLSKAKKRQVGAIIVGAKGGIIAEGCNGTPTGFDNVCENEVGGYAWKGLETKAEVLHAESNAIAKVAKSTNSSEGATLYTTLEPCFNCAKMIIQAGIKRVVYYHEYEKHEGLALLKKAKIKVKQIQW